MKYLKLKTRRFLDKPYVLMDVSLTLPEGISGEEWVFLYNQYRVKMTYIGLQFVSSTTDARDVDKRAMFMVSPKVVQFHLGNNMSLMPQREAIAKLKTFLAAFCTIYSYQFFIDRVPQEVDPSKRESAIRLFESINPERLYN